MLAAGLLALVALVLAITSIVRLQTVSRAFSWLSGQSGGEVDSLQALLKTVEKNATDLKEARSAIEAISGESRSHLNRIGLVRFDAFDGVAGQQSYSLCMLDDNSDGLLLSNLVGANFSRSYALQIDRGEAPRELGEEESRALQIAMNRSDR